MLLHTGNALVHFTFTNRRFVNERLTINYTLPRTNSKLSFLNCPARHKIYGILVIQPNTLGQMPKQTENMWKSSEKHIRTTYQKKTRCHVDSTIIGHTQS